MPVATLTLIRSVVVAALAVTVVGCVDDDESSPEAAEATAVSTLLDEPQTSGVEELPVPSIAERSSVSDPVCSGDALTCIEEIWTLPKEVPASELYVWYSAQLDITAPGRTGGHA